MGKLKKICALLLSFIFISTLVQPNLLVKAESKNTEKVYVKIRYNRPDDNYEGWNLWVWEKDKEGKKVDFIGEDSDGKFAVVETTKGAEQLGFILRKSVPGNEWAENYFGHDKFVNLLEGDQEAVVNHVDDGEKPFDIKKINRNFDEVTLRLHYFRFDNNYDNWDIWSWMEGKDGNGYPLASHEYGSVSEIKYTNVENGNNIGFLVRRPDWSEKDGDKDRFVNIAYANNDGIINAYIVQSDSGVYYSEDEAVKDPKVVSLKMDSLTELSFKTNFKLHSQNINDKITLKENGVPIAVSATVPETLIEGIITTEKNMDLTKKYTLEIEGFSSKDATLGRVYGSKDFEDLYHYDGDLGANYSKDKTSFVLWAPTATEVKLALFGKDGSNYTNAPTEVINMTKGDKGIWTTEKSGDINGEYYTYLVTTDGAENEVTDPYAKAVGVNGNRAMVIDLQSTNPEGWNEDKKPELIDPTDSIIYEMHIRDFSIDEKSGVSLEYKGKYNGVWQDGTTIPGTDVKTGVDHLKELGVNTVHLLPTFDHRSIDETKLDKEQYNWGYDPQNYNTPEGSYSSDPYAAEIRIKEFKEMVKELHKAGIRVVMDVVYNHTGATADSHLNKAVPDYYYRQNATGGFSNGSGCGNETASERSMVRKMMVDSIAYWAKEYHIDGFRFDLMGLHDVETMKQIRTELNKIDESILIYGEGWTGGDSPLPDEDKAVKVNTPKYGDLQIAAFSDDMRDGVKGHVFEEKTPGFINGFNGLEELVKFGVVAATKHDEVKLGENPGQYNGYGTVSWANQPYQTVNYTSAHDNNTLWDKLQITNPDASKEELLDMNKMSAAIVLTSQGIPFFQAGEEMARTKVNPDGSFNHNSYNAPDSVNKMEWTRKEEYKELFDYYKGLIELRKSHKMFRMNTTEDIQNSIDFIDVDTKNVVAYTLNGENVQDKWDDVAVIFNANNEEVEVTLPDNEWVVVVNEDSAGVEELSTLEGSKVKVPAKTSYVLVDKDSYSENGNDGEGGEEIKPIPINNKPEIKAEDKEIKKGSKFNPLEGVTAIDVEDGDLTNKIEVVENNVNVNKIGKYTVKYRVTDSNDNTTELTINVTVTGSSLPNTGGTNMILVILIGIVLVGIGSVLVTKKKIANK